MERIGALQLVGRLLSDSGVAQSLQAFGQACAALVGRISGATEPSAARGATLGATLGRVWTAGKDLGASILRALESADSPEPAAPVPADPAGVSEPSTVRAADPVRLSFDMDASAAALSVAGGRAAALGLGDTPRTEAISHDSPVNEIANSLAAGTYSEEQLNQAVLGLTGVDVAGKRFAEGTKFLFVVPTNGYFSPELTLTHQALTMKGAQVEFMTETGASPVPYGVSLQPGFADESYKRIQIQEGHALLGQQYLTTAQREQYQQVQASQGLPALTQGNSYGHLLEPETGVKSLQKSLPSLPRYNEGEEARARFQAEAASQLQENFAGYAGVVFVGGGGAANDFGYNPRAEMVAEYFYKQKKPVVGICYGSVPLVNARDSETGAPLLKGHFACGHDTTDDYMVNSATSPEFGVYDPTPSGTATVELRRAIMNAVGPAGGYYSSTDTPLLAVRSSKDGHDVYTGLTVDDGWTSAMLLLAGELGEGKLPENFVIDGNQLGHELTGSDPKLHRALWFEDSRQSPPVSDTSQPA